jgi:hypothetical protein
VLLPHLDRVNQELCGRHSNEDPPERAPEDGSRANSIHAT